MRWTAVIVACLSHLTLSHSDNSLVNSATRKFFFADSHENIDEKRGVASYHDDEELLPFGNLEDKPPVQYRSAQLTIEQFIDKLKEIQKSKQKSRKNRPEPETRIAKERQKVTKSKQENVPLPAKKGKLKDKKISTVLGNSKTKPPPQLKKSKVLKKGVTKGVSDSKKKKQSNKTGNILKQTTKRKPISNIKKQEADKSPPQKQKKFHKPKFGAESSKDIKQQVEEDFFQSGPVESASLSHIHQHDHLHAHKAFHKHKESHDHSHAHSNDHIHNHKHTHNHVHNHIHKHNEQHEHSAEHSHVEKHHHKHLEYIDAGGWKKRSDENNENTILARSDYIIQPESPITQEDRELPDKLQERSGHLEMGEAENNVKTYLQKYIDFYRSVVEPEEIDKADDRNYYYDEEFPTDSVEEHPVTGYREFSEELNHYFTPEDLGGQHNWDILGEQRGEEGVEGYRGSGPWEPELEELEISLYDLEPDWAPQHELPLERSGRME